MKKTLLYFLFFCISLHTNAQGFSKTYTLGYRYLEFYKNILEHDTLTMYGYVFTKDSIPRIGVCLTKFDTIGNPFQSILIISLPDCKTSPSLVEILKK